MLNYGKGAKRVLFVDKNKTIYTRIEDEDHNISFVELFRMPNDFFNACAAEEETITLISKIPSSISYEDLKASMQIILDLNVKLLRLEESAAFFSRMPLKPEVKQQIMSSLDTFRDSVDTLTYAWAIEGKNHPNYAFNHRPALFDIPGVTQRILDGEETFKDAYGTVETSNNTAYRDLLIREMMSGKDEFHPTELSRIRNGLQKNQSLETQYQASEKKM